MTPTLKMLSRAICDDPWDDVARLAYADELDDLRMHEHANLIKTQIALFEARKLEKTEQNEADIEVLKAISWSTLSSHFPRLWLEGWNWYQPRPNEQYRAGAAPEKLWRARSDGESVIIFKDMPGLQSEAIMLATFERGFPMHVFSDPIMHSGYFDSVCAQFPVVSWRIPEYGRQFRYVLFNEMGMPDRTREVHKRNQFIHGPFEVSAP